MAVVSISMPLELLDCVDEFAEDEGYTGRSEVVREACRGLLGVVEDHDGPVVGTASVVFEDGEPAVTDHVSTLEAAYDDIVSETTQLSVTGDYCLASFVLEGNPHIVSELLDELRATPAAHSVDHTLTPIEI